MELNEYQKAAINHFQGPALVTSVPGSGKTTILTSRVVKLIEKGISPQNILCLTFTNKAANEMRERICKALNVKKVNFFIGTFHSLCAKLLRKVGDKRGYSPNFTILDEYDQLDLIAQVARSTGEEIEKKDLRHIAYHLNTYREKLETFDWLENKLSNDIFIRIAYNYLERCRINNLIDFAGLIYEAIKIIEDNNDIREKLQNIFKFILVDETQDTSGSQFFLINLLAAKWKNIMITGDIDQSIYNWRNARYQNIQDFLRLYKDCEIYYLSKNYRSTPQIIEVSDRLIKHNIDRIKIKFETDNESGERVCCYVMEDQFQEANWIANRIKRLINEGGWDPSDFAVFYRMNKMSEPLERALVSQEIPYEVIGGWNFYNRKESKDCLAMLKFLVNKRDGISFHRLCSLLSGIGDVTVGKIENKMMEKNIDLDQACLEMATETNILKVRENCQNIYNIYKEEYDLNSPASCLKSLINKFNYRKHLMNKFGENGEERIENIDQLVDSAALFSGPEDAVQKYLQQISLVTSNDKENKDNKVSLMTLHAAKGLEFPIVFIVGVEEKILPHIKSLNSDSNNNLEEERRLCYVGMTRAKKLLYLTWCRNRQRFGKYNTLIRTNTKPSRFLKESGLR